MNKLEELEETLIIFKNRKYCLENSDDRCYTNGRMKELTDKINNIEFQIKELKNNND